MTPEETAEAAKDHVSRVGGGFMLSRATREAGAALGLGEGGWTFYVAGRAGVLGRVDPDVVTAALVFFPPSWVREHWEAVLGAVEPREAARAYARCCGAWGRKRLSQMEGIERLAELAERVVAAGDPPGLPLFAGWRALELPPDPPARAVQLCNVLREHRGNAHALAVLAHGLRPLEALVAGPNGPGNAEFFGWPGPYPEAAPFADRWRRAEDATTAQVAPAYAALDDAERQEFTGLLARASATAFRPR